MVTYKVEKMADILEEFKVLCVLHWEEIAAYREDIALDPDWDKYLALDAAGLLFVLTARDHGDLVGYSIFICNTHLHYKQTKMAMNDLVFILPRYRGFAGAKLIIRSHQELVARGADRIMWHIKAKNDWSSALQKLGYLYEEVMMGIHIKRG